VAVLPGRLQSRNNRKLNHQGHQGHEEKSLFFYTFFRSFVLLVLLVVTRFLGVDGLCNPPERFCESAIFPQAFENPTQTTPPLLASTVNLGMQRSPCASGKLGSRSTLLADDFTDITAPRLL